METELSIRTATEADWECVADFNCRLASETEGKELNREKIDPGVRAVLEDVNRGVYYLAEKDGGVIGQLMITREWSDWRNGWFWWIQSLYVIAESRGQGVFKSLYRHVESEAAKSNDVRGLRLYVDEDNQRAQDVYARLGMNKSRYEFFELEF
ncbi:MAG: GNAT family N-acetyltransferase [Limisphaerales bacterium]